MDSPNFDVQFNQKISKIRSLLENLPRFADSSRTSQPKVDVSNESSGTESKVTPKVEYGGLLQSDNPFESLQDNILVSEPQLIASNAALSKKKKKKKRTIDPLRPTKRRSFGVDIGQGINTILYIKENCCPYTVARRNRLMNIFLSSVPCLKTEKSMENIYRQLPLSQENSRMNMISKKELGKKAGDPEIRGVNTLFTESEDDMYRLKYKDYVTEIPNDFGIDDLQELFVPYHRISET